MSHWRQPRWAEEEEPLSFELLVVPATKQRRIDRAIRSCLFMLYKLAPGP